MNIKILENLKTPDKKNLLIFAGSILICLSAGLISKISVTPEALIWYEYLFKPAFTTPSWIFQGVWAVLYILMGISLYLVLQKDSTVSKKITLIIFGSQLLLNILWTPVFFGFKSTLGGFFISILLWLCIITTFYKFYKITIPAALLIIPVVLWSAYLVGLNFTFWMLNNTQWVFWSFKQNLP